jgi:hypothetical protein
VASAVPAAIVVAVLVLTRFVPVSELRALLRRGATDSAA